MRDLVLIAASGLARETLALVRSTASHRITGFLDDDPARRGTAIDGMPVLGGLEDLRDHPNASLVVCAGGGSVRHRIVERLESQGVSAERYATVVHPQASVAQDCTIGHGSIVLAGAVATTSVTVGRHAVLMPHVVLTHDADVGDYATLCAGVCLGGSVRVGVEAYLGMNASVKQDVTVGARSTLGMGSALLTDLPDDEVWAGSPARRLDTHRSDEQ